MPSIAMVLCLAAFALFNYGQYKVRRLFFEKLDPQQLRM